MKRTGVDSSGQEEVKKEKGVGKVMEGIRKEEVVRERRRQGRKEERKM